MKNVCHAQKQDLVSRTCREREISGWNFTRNKINPISGKDGYFINPEGNLGHPVAYTHIHLYTSPTYIHKSHIHK